MNGFKADRAKGKAGFFAEPSLGGQGQRPGSEDREFSPLEHAPTQTRNPVLMPEGAVRAGKQEALFCSLRVLLLVMPK